MITLACMAFWLHSVLCAGFALWAIVAFARAVEGGAGGFLPRTVRIGHIAVAGDETVVNGVTYVILGLFLLYAEVYLYRVYTVATAFTS